MTTTPASVRRMLRFWCAAAGRTVVLTVDVEDLDADPALQAAHVGVCWHMRTHGCPIHGDQACLVGHTVTGNFRRDHDVYDPSSRGSSRDSY